METEGDERRAVEFQSLRRDSLDSYEHDVQRDDHRQRCFNRSGAIVWILTDYKANDRGEIYTFQSLRRDSLDSYICACLAFGQRVAVSIAQAR